ncbi:hypothetical protein [Terribacillus aidingensis]|uniref:hypothetical protein n=1 Tax=Terribacillus aidingensis TaxID=586416 RepID=UPI00117E571E|nr:hypothetical protein [Terribacillus aidingensis]
MPNKIPTRLYGRRAMGPSAGGTIWGGAFSPTRGFPATLSSAVPQAAEQAEEVPSLEVASPITDSVIVPEQLTPPPVETVDTPVESTALGEVTVTEPQGAAAPNFVPATPVPYQPEQINGFKTEQNADGTRSIFINNSRITIPDLDILAAIPD